MFNFELILKILIFIFEFKQNFGLEENNLAEVNENTDVGILGKFTDFFAPKTDQECPGSDLCWEKSEENNCRIKENSDCYSTMFTTDKLEGK